MEIMIFVTVGMIIPIKWIFRIQMSWNPLLWVSFYVHKNCRIAPKSWLSGCFLFLFSCKHLLSKALCYQHVSLYDNCNGDIIPILFSLCITIYTNSYWCSRICSGCRKRCCWSFSHFMVLSLFSLSAQIFLALSAPSRLGNIGLIA